MTKDEWKARTTEATQSISTYRKEFDSVIDALADILAQRDAAFEEFIDSGGEAVTEFTSDRGAVNLKKNPRLAVWMDLNNQALVFWRDLGLSPAGLKKLNDAALKPEQKESALEKALEKFGAKLG